MSTAIPFLAVDRSSPAQDVPTPVAGDTSYVIQANDGLALVVVVNPDASDHDVTVTPTATIGGLAAAPVVITVLAGTAAHIGPWPPAMFNDDSGECTFSDPSGLLEFTGVRI